MVNVLPVHDATTAIFYGEQSLRAPTGSIHIPTISQFRTWESLKTESAHREGEIERGEGKRGPYQWRHADVNA